VGLLLGYMALKPPAWRAQASLLLPFGEGDTPSAGGGAAALLMRQADPLSILRGIVVSRASLDRISKETGLPYKTLEDQLKTSISADSNQLTLSMRVNDKEQGLKVLDSAIRALGDLSRTNTISVASRQADLLRQTIQKREAELNQAEKDLLNFTRTAKTAPDPASPLSSASAVKRLKDNELALASARKQLEVERAEQKRRVAPAESIPTGIPEIEDWRKKLGEAQFQLRAAQGQLGDKNPQVVRLRFNVDAARASLQRAVQGYLQAADQSLSPELANLESRVLVLESENKALKEISDAAPSEAASLSRLSRRVEALSESVKALRIQYDMAATRAEVDRVRWSLLVPPYVDDRPVNKSLTLHVGAGTALGALLGTVVIVVRSRRRSSA
jgi:uncharacterized protein involved in exopolysaccharide biosynthesis